MSATHDGSDDRIDADFIRSLEGVGWDDEPHGLRDLVVDVPAEPGPLYAERWD
jgi:hypothetical protein